MRRFTDINCTCALALCVVSVVISIYPGALQQLLFLLMLSLCIVVPVWIGLFVFCFIQSKRKPDETESIIPWKRVAATGLVLLVAYAAIKFYIPRRLAFPMSQSAFAMHVATAPESDFGGQPLGRWLGIYYVDEYAKDPRGGVYSRTGTSANMINTVSWGFVYQPNRDGSPFGKAWYRTHPLGGDWYWFVANDDF